MGFGKILGGIAGGALGGYFGGQAGAAAGGAFGSIAGSGGKISFGNAILGGLSGLGAHELSLGLDIYGGGLDAAADAASEYGDDYGGDYGGDWTGAAKPLEAATGVGTDSKGLLSRVLDSKFLNSERGGQLLLGVGKQIAAGDSANEAGRAAGAVTRAKQDEISKNYEMVRPPSDAKGRYVKDPETGKLVFVRA